MRSLDSTSAADQTIEGVDGVIFFGLENSDQIGRLIDRCAEAEVPIIGVDAELEDDRVAEVRVDFRDGTRTLVHELIAATKWSDALDSEGGVPQLETPVFLLYNSTKPSPWLVSCKSHFKRSGFDPREISAQQQLVEICHDSDSDWRGVPTVLRNEEVAGRLLGMLMLEDWIGIDVLRQERQYTTSAIPGFLWDRGTYRAPRAIVVTECTEAAHGVLDVLSWAGLRVPQDLLLATVNSSGSRYGTFLSRVEPPSMASLCEGAVRILLDGPEWHPSPRKRVAWVKPAVRLRPSTGHWLFKFWRSIPGSCTIRRVDGGLIAANPYFERMLGAALRDLRGKQPSVIWPGDFGKQIESLDKRLAGGDYLVTYENSRLFKRDGPRRITLRFPIKDSGGSLYLGSISVAYDWLTQELGSREYLVDPIVELEDVALDPDEEILLAAFFDQAPTSLIIRTDAPLEGRNEAILYANECARQLFGLRSTRGLCSDELSSYFNERSSSEGDHRLFARQSARIVANEKYANLFWRERLQSKDQMLPSRWVLAFDILGGTFTKSGEASLGLCSTILNPGERMTEKHRSGIVSVSKLDGPHEEYPGRFKRSERLP